jgi:predicted nucleotidyltransferase
MDCSKAAVTKRIQEREQLLRQELTRITGLLKTRAEVHLVLLFGSLAAGRCGQHSDLDLVVVLDTDLKFRDRVEELHRWINPEVELDLLVYTPEEWRTLRQRGFLRRLSGQGQVLHEVAA